MSTRNTLVRSMHDLGLAAWFGGTLMGAVGLNGGIANATDPEERLRLSSAGWGRWAPVQLTAIVVHGIGGIGLILGNKTRLAGQSEARHNTAIKLVATGLALAASVQSGLLGTKIARHADEGGEGVTEPSAASSPALAYAQKQQRILQWIVPALTGLLIILGAQQGEQQRPAAGLLRSLGRR